MKIICVLPASPLPFGDTAARWFYAMLTQLIERGHTIICYIASEESPEKIAAATSHFSASPSIVFKVFRPTPDPVFLRRKLKSLTRPYGETFNAPGLRRSLDEDLASGYDILHLEQLWTGWLGIGNPRCVLNIHHLEIIDWEDRTNLSRGEQKALLQMKRATKKIIRGTKNMRMFTERLHLRAKEINPTANYRVIPFALDLSLYPLLPAVSEPVVGLFGSMHWHPSRSAGIRLITRIWPLIKQQLPAARLFISGWNARKYLGNLVNSDDIELTENLPKPTDFFSHASVMVYPPSRGSGMKIKVMESMAYGMPVVTTWEGVEGLAAESGRDCEVAESDEDLAARTVSLLKSPDNRARMRANARDLIEKKYAPGPVVDQLEAFYKAIIGGLDPKK